MYVKGWELEEEEEEEEEEETVSPRHLWGCVWTEVWAFPPFLLSSTSSQKITPRWAYLLKKSPPPRVCLSKNYTKLL